MTTTKAASLLFKGAQSAMQKGKTPAAKGKNMKSKNSVTKRTGRAVVGKAFVGGRK